MELVVVALIVVVVAALPVWLVGRARVAANLARSDAASGRKLQILALFGPAIEQAAADPRAFVTWAPIAATTRTLFPDECAEIDRAFGGHFPFSDQDIERAHGRWTADWLAWERTHDGVYKLKAAEALAALTAATARSSLSQPGPTDEGQAACALARARVDDVERDKLDLYQRRYEEYVRLAKALQALRSR